MTKNELMIKGSLNELANRNSTSIAATAAINAKVVLIVDTSGSMSYTDVVTPEIGHESRIDAAQRQLSLLQRKHEGACAIIEFNSNASFLPSGILGNPTGTTNLADALLMAKSLNLAGLPVVIISDGEPDDETMPMHIIRDFTGGEVSAIYIGPKQGYGEEYLRRLVANAGNRGKLLQSKGVGEFLEATEQLLLNG